MSPFLAKIFSGCEKVFYFSPILSRGDLGEYGIINQTQVVIQFIMFFPLRITAIVFVDQILI